MTVQGGKSTSTNTAMEDDIEVLTHVASSPSDRARFHHDTEQQDLSHLPTSNTAAFELAKQKNFDLEIPDEDQYLGAKFRIVKKAFAIACHTTMSKERILQHLQDVFYKRIRYICISSPRNLSSNPGTVYIQILFREIVTKKEYFMERVAGMRCNYRVTCDDRSWNRFLKKVGPYLERGEFYSIKSRAGPRLRGVVRRQHREKKETLKNSTPSTTMTTVEQIVNDSATNVTSDVNATMRRTIDLAFELIAAECARQRELLIQQFASNHNAQ